MNGKQKKLLLRIAVSALLALTAYIADRISVCPRSLIFILFISSYVIVSYDILKKAAVNILHGQVFDENFLMAVASAGAIALGDLEEACAVMIFYQTGELFQSVAVGKSRDSITALLDLTPEYAVLVNDDGSTEDVFPDEIETGSTLMIRTGEKVPVDGTVLRGSSVLNTTALTGESRPVSVQPGDPVLSGSVNEGEALFIRTDRPYDQSTAALIIALVENSASRKAKSEEFITRFARVYTPSVCGLALLLSLIPSLVTGNWEIWCSRALSFLVTSCPCALVISIPLSFYGAIGGASRKGILVKGSNYLEALSRTGTAVFDKTGTLTKGTFTVTGIFPSPGTNDRQLLSAAAAAEMFSTHPIAKAIIEAAGSASSVPGGRGISYPGKGAAVETDGVITAAGSVSLMEELGATPAEVSGSGTVVHVCSGGIYLGYLLISDELKVNSLSAVSWLKEQGIRTVMLTGDGMTAAQQTADALGIDEFHFSLLPGDKVSIVERLLNEQKKDRCLLFAGDGINDAPVIMRADIGVAMGALGSDAAIEAADIVLMDDDPSKLLTAVSLSRKCMRIVRENIIFAISVKLMCLILVALGVTGMWTAVVADVGVMMLAVLNSMRMLSA